MHDSAGADVFFRCILPFTLTCIQFILSLAAESQLTSPELVLVGEFVQERS